MVIWNIHHCLMVCFRQFLWRRRHRSAIPHLWHRLIITIIYFYKRRMRLVDFFVATLICAVLVKAFWAIRGRVTPWFGFFRYLWIWWRIVGLHINFFPRCRVGLRVIRPVDVGVGSRELDLILDFLQNFGGGAKSWLNSSHTGSAVKAVIIMLIVIVGLFAFWLIVFISEI